MMKHLAWIVLQGLVSFAELENIREDKVWGLKRESGDAEQQVDPQSQIWDKIRFYQLLDMIQNHGLKEMPQEGRLKRYKTEPSIKPS